MYVVLSKDYFELNWIVSYVFHFFCLSNDAKEKNAESIRRSVWNSKIQKIQNWLLFYSKQYEALISETEEN